MANSILSLFKYNQESPFVFQTGFFLFIFSAFLIVYAFIHKETRKRNVAIVLFSLFFYYKASGIFIILLMLTSSVNYLFSFIITKRPWKWQKKFWLTLGILFSLFFLIYFKYKNFFLENIAAISGTQFTLTTLILPVGISFYTFQTISYIVDIYKGEIERPRFQDHFIYMTFFPHLVAGPIVRAKDFIPQLKTQINVNKDTLNEAIYLITKGFVKKTIIADFIAQYADNVFSQPSGFSKIEHIYATLCYTLQIFCDFSGYTDMAIGIALLLGFRLGINFNSPYKSKNITEFWRRWHISLSFWLRDYVYIPMGGNRKGFLPQLIFILITMLIGGIWHGASWKFIFWGAAHGVLLISHKIFKRIFPSKSINIFTKGISWIITFSAVALLWIPFRATDMQDTITIYSKIFIESNNVSILDVVRNNILLFILFSVGYFFALMPTKWKNSLQQMYYDSHFTIKIIFLICLIQVMIQISSSSAQPFIYFQF